MQARQHASTLEYPSSVRMASVISRYTEIRYGSGEGLFSSLAKNLRADRDTLYTTSSVDKLATEWFDTSDSRNNPNLQIPHQPTYINPKDTPKTKKKKKNLAAPTNTNLAQANEAKKLRNDPKTRPRDEAESRVRELSCERKWLVSKSREMQRTKGERGSVGVGMG